MRIIHLPTTLLFLMWGEMCFRVDKETLTTHISIKALFIRHGFTVNG